MHGEGMFTWPNGNKYDGGYKNDQRHGQGSFLWADGRTYIGEWENSE